MRGVVSTVDPDPDSLITKARSIPPMEGLNLVDYVTCNEPYEWDEGLWNYGYKVVENFKYSVVVIDFGIRKNILRNLASNGIKPIVVPAKTPPEEILKLGVKVRNPAFDVTPRDYIDLIITEIGAIPPEMAYIVIKERLGYEISTYEEIKLSAKHFD